MIIEWPPINQFSKDPQSVTRILRLIPPILQHFHGAHDRILPTKGKKFLGRAAAASS